ncbi:MAG: hypothetical protein H0U19_12785 [Acidobacteria bacterium]|nr:hypothetical protein [Acidobacteriota bacterium]
MAASHVRRREQLTLSGDGRDRLTSSSDPAIANLEPARTVIRIENHMTILQKLFAPKVPAQRIRICVECGMPIAEHKDWCSIYRTQREMDGGKK